MTAVMVLLLPSAASPWVLTVLCFFWGVGITALSLAMVSRVLRFADDATDVATSIYSSLYNVGIGGGALFGRYAVQQFGLEHVGFAGAALAAAALPLCFLLVRRADFADT